MNSNEQIVMHRGNMAKVINNTRFQGSVHYRLFLWDSGWRPFLESEEPMEEYDEESVAKRSEGLAMEVLREMEQNEVVLGAKPTPLSAPDTAPSPPEEKRVD